MTSHELNPISITSVTNPMPFRYLKTNRYLENHLGAG